MDPRFDPKHAFKFDLKKGRVLMDRSAPRVIVPADALVELCLEAGGELQRSFAAHLGAEVGRRVAERLPQLAGVGPDVVLEHLGGEWALLGLGSLNFERWGSAFVVGVEDSPFGARGDALLASALEGCLQRAVMRDVSVVALHRDAEQVRFIVLNAEAATELRAWLTSGVGWADAVARLQIEEASA